MTGLDRVLGMGAANPAQVALAAVGDYDAYRAVYAMTRSDRFKAATASPIASAPRLTTPTLLFNTKAVPWVQQQAAEFRVSLQTSHVPVQHVT